MEKWDSYSIVVEDPKGTFPILRSAVTPGTLIVDVGSLCFEDIENWVKYYWPGEWRKVLDHFATGIKWGVCDDGGRLRIETVRSGTYIITVEKMMMVKKSRACVECKHYMRGWNPFGGRCRRLQSEECDLICGGIQFVGPMLECKEERGIKRGLWERLRIGSDICGKEGKYWVEK